MENKIIAILKELGIPMGNLGFGYITEAVKIVAEDKKQLQYITKPDGLYWVIAKKYGTMPTRVERAIRHAIEQCFFHSNHDAIIRYFGYTTDVKSGKLTNRNFIAALANEVSPVQCGIIKETVIQSIPNGESTKPSLSDYTIEELMRELFTRIQN